MKNKMKEEKPKYPKSGYWYKFYTDECVLCGAGETIKYRQYTPKPKDARKRYDYRQYACDDHFM